MNVTPEQAMKELAAFPQALASAQVPQAMEKSAKVIRESIASNFDQQRAPDGGAWQPRKPRPGDDGHPLLRETGALLAAATGSGSGAITEISGREMTIGIDTGVDLGGIPGAAAHHFGYPPRNLPQREFYAATEEKLNQVGDIIGDSVFEKIS